MSLRWWWLGKRLINAVFLVPLAIGNDNDDRENQQVGTETPL